MVQVYHLQLALRTRDFPHTCSGCSCWVHQASLLQALLCPHTTGPCGCQWKDTHTLLSLSLPLVLSIAHPLTCTCLRIPSQHLAWHLTLLSLSEQFKWIIRLVMQRKWIVYLLISDQSPLSCSWCRIRLALCEMTLDSVLHCNTLWVPVKSGTSSPGRGPFLRRQLTSSIPPPQMRHKRHVSIISARGADVNLYHH